MPLTDIVNVQITSETASVSRASFGTAVIIGDNPTFAGRIQYYTDLASIAADLTGGTGDAEYKMAVDIFAQSPRPATVALGRQDIGDANFAETLDAILLESTDFYGVLAVTRITAEQKEIADWVEANERIYVCSNSDSDIIDETVAADTTSIAALCKSASLTRTTVIYHSLAVTEYIDGALLGKILPLDPGSYTAMFKTLASVTVDKLTPTQSKNALDKYANIYQELGGVNIYREGTTSANKFLDDIIFIDWLKARITESIYSLLVNKPKIAYTVNGIASVKSAIDQPLKVGQNRGGISPTEFDSNGLQIGGYVIIVPELSSIPTQDKIERKLDNVQFTAWLAGAIHQVVVNGVVTL